MNNPPLAWIVDDEAVNRILASAFLHRIGWQTREFPNAQAVLQASEQGLPPLMIIDIRMPEMSGSDLVRVLRKHPQADQTRFIAYTAHCVNGEGDALLRDGFHQVLSKPVSFQQMRDAVQGDRHEPA
jgi:CheY-like chemotaxis protein